jgi:hypothetical protein
VEDNALDGFGDQCNIAAGHSPTARKLAYTEEDLAQECVNV